MKIKLHDESFGGRGPLRSMGNWSDSTLPVYSMYPNYELEVRSGPPSLWRIKSQSGDIGINDAAFSSEVQNKPELNPGDSFTLSTCLVLDEHECQVYRKTLEGLSVSVEASWRSSNLNDTFL